MSNTYNDILAFFNSLQLNKNITEEDFVIIKRFRAGAGQDLFKMKLTEFLDYVFSGTLDTLGMEEQADHPAAQDTPIIYFYNNSVWYKLSSGSGGGGAGDATGAKDLGATGLEAAADFRTYNQIPASTQGNADAGKVKLAIEDKETVYTKDENGDVTYFATLDQAINSKSSQPSLIFNGIDAESVIADNVEVEFNENESYTYMSVFKLLGEIDTLSNAGALLLKGQTAQSTGLSIRNDGGNMVLYFGLRGTVNRFITREIELNKWYYTFGVYDGINSKLIVNSVSQSADLTGSGFVGNSDDLLIGGNSSLVGTGTFINIEVADSRIFNLALTESEIEQIMLTREIPYKLQGASNVPIYESDFTSSVDGWSATTGALTFNEVIGGETGALKFTASAGSFWWTQRSNTVNLYKQNNIKVSIYIPSSNNSQDVRVRVDGATIATITTTDAWVDVDINAIPKTTRTLRFSLEGSVNVGDVFYILDNITTLSGNTWGINSKSHGYNTSRDTSNNGNYAQHTNVELNGVSFNFEASDIVDTITATNTQLQSIKAKHSFEYIIIQNNSGSDETIKIGTTSGGDELVTATVIAANSFEKITLNKLFSDTVDTDIYINKSGAGDFTTYQSYKKEL